MSIGYTKIGCGPIRVIMLHGWLSDQSVYDQIKPYFDPEVYSIALMDFRGYGASKGLSGDYSLEEIAQDAISFADWLKWDQFHIIGHSMGGAVAQKVALLAEGRLLSAIALTPVPASGFEMDAETYAFFQSSGEDDAALEGIFDTLTGKRHASAVLKDLVKRARATSPQPAYTGYLEAWVKTDFSADVVDIKTPFLVIAGAHDGALGPDHMRETYLKQLSNVKMEVIESAGHYPMIETPPELFGKIETFLKEKNKSSN